MPIQSRVSHQNIDGEVVIINLENGTYYSLLGLAARLWELIAAGWSREDLLDLAGATYAHEELAGESIDAFLDELVREGMITEGPSAREGDTVVLPSPFSPPVIETFTDLQELLMLDPIHEVDVAGWPHKPAGS